MKKQSYFVLYLFLFGFSQFSYSSSQACGKDYNFTRKDKISVSAISLQQKGVEGFFFYLFEKNYVVKLQQNDVVELLSKNQSFGEYSLLLEKVKKDLPLKENVDINKYSFDSAFLYSTSKRLAADLIENGKSAVTDMLYGKNGEPLKEISLVHLENGGAYRLICDTSKHLIFETTDSIE